MAEPGRLHAVLGTGPVGLATIDALLRRGEHVRAVNQRGQARLPGGVEMMSGDITDPGFGRAACKGAAVVYNCLHPPYSKWPELLAGLWEAAIGGAESAGARLVVMDNLYMYGATHGQPMTEDSALLATTKKGRLRIEMAEKVLAAHRTGRVEAVIARASDYFGPRATNSAMGDRVFGAALKGSKAQVLGDPGALHTYTYVPDIGEALAVLGERREAAGKVWHVPSPRTVATREFVEMVYAAAGTEMRLQAVSKLLLRALGLFVADIRELPEMLYEFEEPFVMDHSRYAAAFGDHATPLEDAIEATVVWYRQAEAARS